MAAQPLSSRISRWAASALVGLSACSVAPASRSPDREPLPTPQAAAARHLPRVVVVIVIDQLPTWSFDPRRSLLTGGIARLLREGTYYRNGYFPYSATYTAPGHATIATGVPPSQHGILANEWYDRERATSRTAVEDPDAPVFVVADTTGSTVGLEGVSGAALRVEGLADALRRQTGSRGRSISVGLKDRAAALLLGAHPDLAIWYDTNAATMTTSRAYAQAPPAWLAARAEHVRQRLDYTWEPLDPAVLAKATGVTDDNPGEGQVYGLDRSFPHALAQTSAPAKAVTFTPLGNELVIDTAIAALEHEKLGLDAVPDLLALTFSAHDYAGHVWGQESWERLDLFLRLDRELERLFRALDERVGEGQWAAVLTSDHGATPLVELSVARGETARRIFFPELVEAVDETLDAELHPAQWVVAIEASTVYLAPEFFAIPLPRQNEALQAAAEALEKVPGIHGAVPVRSLVGDCEKREGDAALICRALDPERSGELFFTAARWHLMADPGEIEGTAHGSLSDEDRIVPVIVMGPDREPGAVEEGPVSMLRVAPTVADLLGITAPAAAFEAPLRRQ